MKRPLTAEQQAKRDERKAQFRALWKKVAAMDTAERENMAARLGLVTVEGRPLSPCNSMLIMLQLPSASVLGGFRQWLKQGRAVRKGEHGAAIWVPINCKANGNGNGNGNGAPVNGDSESVEAMETRFIMGTVFDVSQTQEVESGVEA